MSTALVVLALLCSTCATTSSTARPTDIVPIGFVLPLTGPDRASAEPAIQGATVAVAEINSHKKAGAWRLELVQADDGSNVATAKQACNDLVSNHRVAAIVGVESGPSSIACSALADSAGLPYLSVSAVAYSECTPNVVYMSPLPDQRVTALVDFLIQQRHLRRFYAVGDRSVESIRLLAAATRQIEARGGVLLASEWLSTNSDFGQLGRRIAAAQPDVTVEALSGSGQALYYAATTSEPALRQMPLASLEMNEEAANGITALAAGIYVARDYLSADPGVGNQAWLAALMSRYGDGAVPTSVGAQADDAFELLASSMVIASSARPTAIGQAMTNVSAYGPRGLVEIKPATHGHATLSIHIGRIDLDHRTTQLYVSQPIEPVVACR